MFWNSISPSAGVDKAFAEVWLRVFGSPFSLATLAGPDAYSAMCTKAADGMRQAGGVVGAIDSMRGSFMMGYTGWWPPRRSGAA